MYIPDTALGDPARRAARHLAIVEGPLDGVRVFQCAGGDWRVAALGGAQIGRGSPMLWHLVRLAAGRRVLIFLDNDQPGQAGAARLAVALRPHAERLLVAAPEWYGTCKDPGAMVDGTILEILRQTEKGYDR